MNTDLVEIFELRSKSQGYESLAPTSAILTFNTDNVAPKRTIVPHITNCTVVRGRIVAAYWSKCPISELIDFERNEMIFQSVGIQNGIHELQSRQIWSYKYNRVVYNSRPSYQTVTSSIALSPFQFSKIKTAFVKMQFKTILYLAAMAFTAVHAAPVASAVPAEGQLAAL